MTPNTPQLDSEELREQFRHVIESAYQDMQGVMANRKGYRLRHDELTDHLMQAVQADRAAFADRVLAVVPERRTLFEPVTKRPVTENDKVGIDLEADTKGSLVFIQDNGFNQCHDQVTTAITNLVAEERGEKKDEKVST